MKKRFLHFLFIGIAVLSSALVVAQNIIPLKSKTSAFTLNATTANSTVFSFEISGYKADTVATPKGKETIIRIDNGTPLLCKGAPDLCKLSASFIIPAGATMKIDIIESTYIDYPNVQVAPSKGNLSRGNDPKEIPYTYGKAYQTDAFYPGKLAELREPYILRDYTGQTAVIYPIQYNPISKILRVYTKLTIQLSPKFNTKSIVTHPKSVDREFNEVYRSNFLNYSNERSSAVEESGTMLIICHNAFMQSMQPFVDWKNQTGLKTDIIDVSSIGNDTASIKALVRHYYDSLGLKYLLLVGDAAQVTPGETTAGISDNWYGYLKGNDSYPEIFVGRFSAETTDQVTTQVQRTISYEKNPLNTGWLKRGICIGSTEGGNGLGDKGEADWQHQRNIRNRLLGYTYSYVKELFDGTQGGGTDDSGDPNQTSVINQLTQGAGALFYTGHGSAVSFITTGFSKTNINTLDNPDKWPFIWSVACVNGNFNNQTCFAEAWLRASHNGHPTGALATLMSTIDQSWEPPMFGQDEMANILTESYTNNIKRSFGGISMNGCMKMNDAYGAEGSQMTDTWTVFGDPSVMLRTDSAKTITATIPQILPVGASQFQVSSTTEGGKVALTIHNKIIGVAFIQGGIATITIPPITLNDTILTTITAYNHIPFIGTTTPINCNGPFLSYLSNTINDIASNNNQQVENGENILLNVSIENNCVDTAKKVMATLSSTDAFITITKNEDSWETIMPKQAVTRNNAFSIHLSDSIPDQHFCTFAITMRDSLNNEWIDNFNLHANAPSLSIGSYTMNEIANNTNPGLLDPNETVVFNFHSINTGHADAKNTVAKLTSTSSYITISKDSINLGAMTPSTDSIVSFAIQVNPSTPAGTVIDFKYKLSSGFYSIEKTFTKTVGLSCETFEVNNFKNQAWYFSGDAPWTMDSTRAFEGSHCSKSGKIGYGQNSVMQLLINVASPDSISFYKKTSCEEDINNHTQWDYLEFLIDNVSQGWWAGITDWGRASYPIGTGFHTLKWIYTKDNSNSAGEDCAWVDNIVFPPMVKAITKVSIIPTGIYPNPASDEINIKIDLEIKSDVVVTILNIMGDVVYSETRSDCPKGANTLEIAIPNLANGVYLCQTKTSSDFYSQRIIISK